jgi:Spy/CpxP family protein refolding chaperone
MSKWMSVTRLFAAAMVIGFCGSTLMAKDANEPNKPKHKMRDQQRPMKDPVEMRMESMTKNLDLTKAQQDTIKPIVQDQVKQMQALRTDQSIAPEQKRAKMQAIMQETNTKIDAQLTPEQKEKFKKQQAQMKSRMEERKGKMQEQHAEHKAPDANSKK